MFEDEITRYTGARHADVVCNGTAALICALKAVMPIGGGYEVTTPYTFIATADAIRHAGFTPMFVDIESDGVNISPEEIEKALTHQQVRCVLPVHLFGEPCRIEEIKDICDRYDLRLIEDASQAFGLRVGTRMAGTFGDAGTYSFYATKNMGACGEGGAVVTDSVMVHERVAATRDHGMIQLNRERVKVLDGYNFKMSWRAAFDGQQFLALHKRSVESELGEKGLEVGYYTRLVYQHPWYAENPFEWTSLPCPNAEALAEKQRRRFQS